MKTQPFWRNVTAASFLGLVALGVLGGKPALAFSTNLVAAQDSTIKLENPNDNFGAGGDLTSFVNGAAPTEDRRILFSFDLSFLAGVTIQSATLKLGVPTLDANPPFDGAHNVQRLLRDFVENQVTWNNYSTGNAWGAAGGLGGADSVNVANNIEAGEVDPAVHWANGGLNVSTVVSNWFLLPDTTQLGFLLYHPAAGGVQSTWFGSTESLNGPGPGPVLEIVYIPEPTVMGLLGLAGLLAVVFRHRKA